MYNGGLEQIRAKAQNDLIRGGHLVTPQSVWIYKDVQYQVNSLMHRNLSQDPETGDWEATVRYTLFPNDGLVFYRSFTEWLRKFQKVTD